LSIRGVERWVLVGQDRPGVRVTAVLVNAAGVFAKEKTRTADGIDLFHDQLPVLLPAHP
jgi:hypothetical protein